MIVTFNPMINTGADANAAYMNFLRCVTAACTAAAGTTSLTVNPFTNNTGTIDNTKNCIVSIDANTEAGGWSTSASHNVPNTGSFTAIASAAAYLYKADFYNASGKSGMPYNKMSVHYSGRTTAVWTSYLPSTYAYGHTVASFATTPILEFTSGCSTTSDWTGTSYPPQGGAQYPNSGTQTSSWTLNEFQFNYASSTSRTNITAFWVNNTSVTYKIAVTATYCIIWEVPNGNSYTNGYGNVCGVSGTPTPSNQPNASYGTLIYMGMRETQPWENALSNNPPWVSMQIQHTNLRATPAALAPTGQNQIAAYMITRNNAGVATATPTTYYSTDYAVAASSVLTGERTFLQNTQLITTPATVNTGLDVPLFNSRDVTSLNAPTNLLYLPSTDPTTGSLVPPAHPIMARKTTDGLWSAGGALRGIYKSFSAPIATMKLYFSDGQTFTVGSDTYMPVVFNETMYLVRVA